MNAGMRPVISGLATGPHGPVAFARVLVEEAPAPMPDVAALTGEDGSFTLATVGPGRYVLAVHADGFLPARAVAMVDLGDTSVDVRVRVFPEADLEEPG